MSVTSDQRAADFLAIAGQFKLGVLVTEQSHRATANLSETVKRDVAAGLDQLFEVDEDVVAAYRVFVASGRTRGIANAVLAKLRAGGRVFFTGCGSTGRLSILLDSVWRSFWQARPDGQEWEGRTRSSMAGGDFALIKSVEGFEDYTQFGRRQVGDMGIGPDDVLFAITEGGETSWVIGTAWEALDRGAAVYFVYDNPDDVLQAHVERSREVIDDARIEKINLTTGPMAITGSTRMQATTIQLCVLLTVMEIVVRELLGVDSSGVEETTLDGLRAMLDTLRSPAVLGPLAEWVEAEARVYRAGGRCNYFADRLGIDILTDTTERSPTYCTPPFRRFDDTSASESWAFLFLPDEATPDAWKRILRREALCVDWPEDTIRAMIPADKADRTIEIVRRIGLPDLMKFRIGRDGLPLRPLGPGDCAAMVADRSEAASVTSGYLGLALGDAAARGARVARILLTEPGASSEPARGALDIALPVPGAGLLLDGVARAGLKMLLNALSTCTMVRLGRVMGNTMIYVVASNLKLIDRSTRYIARLTGLEYEEACRRLFESTEYIEPRMKADQAYPPVVGLTVLSVRESLSLPEAEKRLWAEINA